MAVCVICGTTFDPLGYQVRIGRLPGSFDRIDCAEKAYRRFLSQQHLIAVYGPAEAASLLGNGAAGVPDAVPEARTS